MIIPRSPQLRSEDFDSTVQKWIGQLLSPLNSFISTATSAINGGITFTDNMLGQQKSLSFTYSSGTLPITFAASFSGTPKSLQVVQATENGSPIIVLAAWKSTGSSIQLTDLAKVANGAVSALLSGATYNLTVRVAA